MSDWWKCNPTSSWFDRKDDYGFGVNLSLPLMVIIDDFTLSVLDNCLKQKSSNEYFYLRMFSYISCFLCFFVSIFAIDFLFFACTLCISMLEQILLQRSVKQCLDIEAEKSLRDSVSYLPIVSKHLGKPSITIYYIYTNIQGDPLYTTSVFKERGKNSCVCLVFHFVYIFRREGYKEGKALRCEDQSWGK